MIKIKKYKVAGIAAVLACTMAFTAGCGNKNSNEKSNASNDSKTESVGKSDNDSDAEQKSVEASKNYNKNDVVLTVNDKKMTMEEMLFYIYSYESQIDYMDQMYKYYFNQGYWDMEIGEGLTVRMDAKTQTMKTAEQYAVLYQEAVKQGYKLSEDEQKKIKENSVAAMKQMSEEQLKLTGFTEDSIYEIQQVWAIADKLHQDIIDGLDIDDEKIKAGVDKEKYKEYDTEYILVPTTTTDDQGNTKDMSEADKKAAKEKADSIYEKVKETKDLSKAVPENDSEVVYTDMNFLPNDENDKTNATYKKEAMKLKNDEISGIVETEDGYYIIKMKNDSATTKYEEAVKEAIQEEETAQFNKYYDALVKDYKITVDDKVWDKIVLGHITIPVKETTENKEDSALTDGLEVEPLPEEDTEGNK